MNSVRNSTKLIFQDCKFELLDIGLFLYQNCAYNKFLYDTILVSMLFQSRNLYFLRIIEILHVGRMWTDRLVLQQFEAFVWELNKNEAVQTYYNNKAFY